MTDIETLEAILIRERHKEWEKNNPPQRNLWNEFNTVVDNSLVPVQRKLWNEFNKVAQKYNSPDLVKGNYINNKPLNQTMWKKTYITPRLELQNNIIMEHQLKGALKLYMLICLYPFAVVTFLCLL